MRRGSRTLFFMLLLGFFGCVQGETGENAAELPVQLHPEKIQINRDANEDAPTYTIKGAAGAVTVSSGDITKVWFRVVEATNAEIVTSKADGAISGVYLNGQKLKADGSFEVSFTRAVSSVLVLAAGTPDPKKEKSASDVSLATNSVHKGSSE